MTILIVDDSRTIRSLLSYALREMGAGEIIEADSADKALRILRFCGSVDLIVSDWHMPGMNGLEFVKTLRADPKYQALPIIMSTSESAGENVVAALRAGVTNYVIKPFDKKQLAEKVGPYLTRAKVDGGAGASSCLQAAVSQSGVLSGDDLADVLQFFIQSRKSGICNLKNTLHSASIYFTDGKITGAQFESLAGEEAFYSCFIAGFTNYALRDGEIDILPAHRISLTTSTLLLRALTRMDERKAGK